MQLRARKTRCHRRHEADRARAPTLPRACPKKSPLLAGAKVRRASRASPVPKCNLPCAPCPSPEAPPCLLFLPSPEGYLAASRGARPGCGNSHPYSGTVKKGSSRPGLPQSHLSRPAAEEEGRGARLRHTRETGEGGGAAAGAAAAADARSGPAATHFHTREGGVRDC